MEDFTKDNNLSLCQSCNKYLNDEKKNVNNFKKTKTENTEENHVPINNSKNIFL